MECVFLSEYLELDNELKELGVFDSITPVYNFCTFLNPDKT